MEDGRVYVPVVNVGEEERWLPARLMLGHLHLAQTHKPAKDARARGNVNSIHTQARGACKENCHN